jgi:dTDP-4-amino-4,6-dideoxygalactose transaminase
MLTNGGKEEILEKLNCYLKTTQRKRMKVPLLDLKSQHKTIEEEVNRVVQEVLESGHYILGPNVRALEEEIANYCKVKYAVGVASGTDALRLSLLSLGVGEGDEVIVTPFTFIATAEVITQVGARPTFVDIEEKSFNLDPAKIEHALTSRTKAIIPVHLYGQAVDMGKIMHTAKKHGLKVIEDVAQAFGAEYHSGAHQSKKLGSIGDVGCLSFFPTKNLGGCGDGGMVLTNDYEVARKIKMLRAHGLDSNHTHSLLGYNSRLDELQAAILRVKLRYVNKWRRMRHQNASLYNKLFSSSTIPVRIPCQAPYVWHSFCVYTIRTPKRDRLRDYLKEKGIETKVYYPLPLHLQGVYRNLGYSDLDLPVAERASKEVLSLPIYPGLKKAQIELVVKEIKNFFSRYPI